MGRVAIVQSSEFRARFLFIGSSLPRSISVFSDKLGYFIHLFYPHALCSISLMLVFNFFILIFKIIQYLSYFLSSLENEFFISLNLTLYITLILIRNL